MLSLKTTKIVEMCYPCEEACSSNSDYFLKICSQQCPDLQSKHTTDVTSVTAMSTVASSDGLGTSHEYRPVWILVAVVLVVVLVGLPLGIVSFKSKWYKMHSNRNNGSHAEGAERIGLIPIQDQSFQRQDLPLEITTAAVVAESSTGPRSHTVEQVIQEETRDPVQFSDSFCCFNEVQQMAHSEVDDDHGASANSPVLNPTDNNDNAAFMPFSAIPPSGYLVNPPMMFMVTVNTSTEPSVEAHMGPITRNGSPHVTHSHVSHSQQPHNPIDDFSASVLQVPQLPNSHEDTEVLEGAVGDTTSLATSELGTNTASASHAQDVGRPLKREVVPSKESGFFSSEVDQSEIV